MPWPWGRDSIQKQLEAFESAVLACVQQFWPAKYTEQGQWVGFPREGKQHELEQAKQHVERSEARLQEQFPPEVLGLLAAEMYFSPARWRPRYLNDARGRAMEYILRGCVLKHPAPDIPDRLRARLDKILSHPCGAAEEKRSHLRGVQDPEAYFPPTLDDCLLMLSSLPPVPRLLELARSVVVGDMDRPDVPAPCWEPREMVSQAWYELLFRIGTPAALRPHWAAGEWASEGQGKGRSYEIRATTLRLRLPGILDLLWRNGMLDERMLLTAVRHVPSLLREASKGFAPPWAFAQVQPPVTPQLAEMGRRLAGTVAERACAEFRPEFSAHLLQLEDLRGPSFLLYAARFHADASLGKLVYGGKMQMILEPMRTAGEHSFTVGRLAPREDIHTVVIHLAQTRLSELDRAARDALVERLRGFPRPTLEYLLPLAHYSRPEICRALGWDAAVTLVELIVQTARLGDYLPMWPRETRSTPDPSHGVVDARAVRVAIEAVGDKVAKRIFKLFRQSGLAIGSTIMLMEASAGWINGEIDEKVRKRIQPAIRASGLLPLTRGEDEALERYRFLKQFAKESMQFGMLRQGNEKGAVMAGLENLARNAGYSDATRLEWAMEARLGEGLSRVASWAVGEYQVRLELGGGEIDPVAYHSGERLATMPTAIRKASEYAQVKEAVKEMRAQRARIRASLEALLSSGEEMQRKELEILLRMAVARSLTLNLLWGTTDNFFGLLDADRMELAGLGEARVPVSESVFLVHPYHLFLKGELAEWQKLFIHRRIEQPFKQVFRELYLLTPAEEETRTFSNRFDGRLLSSRVAGRLLQVRGWRSDPGDVALPYKILPRHGLRANFDFPDAGHILAETDTVTSDRIYFWHHPSGQGRWPQEGDWVPLKDVPPIVFSEVMRDADLVVSVAQVGEAILSDESFANRRNLVRHLLEDLGIGVVRVEGHYAYVQGKLAAYKVHLASAHIFIEPGGYLCIVPARWGTTHEQLFLPFPDEPDRKFSEVVSKILLLIDDDRIKDPGILKQIQRGGMGAIPLH